MAKYEIVQWSRSATRCVVEIDEDILDSIDAEEVADDFLDKIPDEAWTPAPHSEGGDIGVVPIENAYGDKNTPPCIVIDEAFARECEWFVVEGEA